MLSLPNSSRLWPAILSINQTSASPGGFHDWKTLYQDRHRFYMWLHTYLDEAKLHYCSPTVPLLEVKNNAEAIYKKQQ